MKRIGKSCAGLLLAVAVAFLTAGITVPAALAGDSDYEYCFHYWSFDGDGNDAAGKLDLSADYPEFTAGRHGQALDTENGDAMRSMKLTEKTTAGYTMGAWFKLGSDAKEWNIIMSKGNTNDYMRDRVQIHIGHASEEKEGGVLLQYSPATAAQLSNEADGKFIPFDTWTQITVTYDLSVLRMYVNGELFAERNASYPLQEALANMNTITVGALNHDGQTFKFCGQIDDAFYANFALTEENVLTCYDSPEVLRTYAKTLVPEGGTAAPTPEPSDPGPGTENPGEIKTGPVLYWSFDGTAKDLSHKEFDIDSDGLNSGYTEGKLGKAIVIDDPIASEILPPDTDLSEFTVAFWVKWEENDNGSYAAPFAVAGKETDHHFEIYFRVSEDTGGLSFYGTGNQWNLENLEYVNRGEYNHIAVANGAGGFRLFLNGELVYVSGNRIVMDGLGTADDFISLGGLNDFSLKCMGEYDELVIAGFEMTDAQISKLYSDPEGAREDIVKMVEANYPEDYTPPTPTPTPTATPEPTPTPEATETPGATAPEIQEATATPEVSPTQNSSPSKSGGCGGLVSGAGALIAVSFVALTLIRKKRN